MLGSAFRKVFGSKNTRELKRMSKLVVAIGEHEEAIKALSDDELQAKTAEFRKRLDEGETLDNLLPESFAVAREAGVRIMEMRHSDAPTVGGITIH